MSIMTPLPRTSNFPRFRSPARTRHRLALAPSDGPGTPDRPSPKGSAHRGRGWVARRAKIRGRLLAAVSAWEAALVNERTALAMDDDDDDSAAIAIRRWASAKRELVGAIEEASEGRRPGRDDDGAPADYPAVRLDDRLLVVVRVGDTSEIVTVDLSRARAVFVEPGETSAE